MKNSNSIVEIFQMFQRMISEGPHLTFQYLGKKSISKVPRYKILMESKIFFIKNFAFNERIHFYFPTFITLFLYDLKCTLNTYR